VKTAQAAELGPHDVGLDLRLGRIRQVLVVAAAALAEVTAARCHPRGRGPEDVEQNGACPGAMDFRQPDADALAGGSEGNEHHAASRLAAERVAAVGHPLDRQLKGLAVHRLLLPTVRRAPSIGRSMASALPGVGPGVAWRNRAFGSRADRVSGPGAAFSWFGMGAEELP